MCLNSDLLDLRPPGHFKIGFFASRITGDPSASCEIIIVMAKYFKSLYGNIYDCSNKLKIIIQILNKNTSPYFHSVSLI